MDTKDLEKYRDGLKNQYNNNEIVKFGGEDLRMLIGLVETLIDHYKCQSIVADELERKESLFETLQDENKSYLEKMKIITKELNKLKEERKSRENKPKVGGNIVFEGAMERLTRLRQARRKHYRKQKN